jgi:hypothetical protein
MINSTILNEVHYPGLIEASSMFRVNWNSSSRFISIGSVLYSFIFFVVVREIIVQDSNFLVVTYFLKYFTLHGWEERQVCRDDVQSIHKYSNTSSLTYP